MSYVSKASIIAVGKSIRKSLLTAFDDGLSDHETRISALASSANKVIVFEYNIDPKDLHIGDIKHANMTLAQFQAVNGSGWVLCDGGSSAGSVYSSVTGQTTVPDVQTAKRFIRAAGSDIVGAGTGQIGSTESDATATNGLSTVTNGGHTHTYSKVDTTSGTALFKHDAASPVQAYDSTANTNTTGTHAHTLTGDSETRPTNISLNYFIKINLSAMDSVVSVKARESMTINNVQGYVIDNNGLPSSGNFEFDIRKSSTDRASLATIFAAKPTLAYAATADGDATSSGVFVGGGATILAGDWLVLDITGLMVGQSGLYISVFGEPS